MKLRIEIDMENDAFTGTPQWELARLISEVAQGLKRGEITPGTDRKLRDVNGNTVGGVSWHTSSR